MYGLAAASSREALANIVRGASGYSRWGLLPRVFFAGIADSDDCCKQNVHLPSKALAFCSWEKEAASAMTELKQTRAAITSINANIQTLVSLPYLCNTPYGPKNVPLGHSYEKVDV